MTAPVLAPTSDGPLQLASAYRLDINTAYVPGTAEESQPPKEWVSLFDVTNFAPAPPAWTKVDVTTYQNADPVTRIVTTSNRKVSQTRVLTGEVLLMNRAAEDVEGRKAIEAAAKTNTLAQVRWYNVMDITEDGEMATVDATWTPSGGATADAGKATFEMELQSPAVVITNPQVAAVAPDATSVSPATADALTMVVITGTNLTGVTNVTFGGVASPLFDVVNATTINAVVAAGAAGSAAIVVTGPGGADSSLAFTRS